MATFALINGGGGSAWDWHLVIPELQERGHEPVAVDLPCEDVTAGWSEYADAVVERVGDRCDLERAKPSLVFSSVDQTTLNTQSQSCLTDN